MSKKIELNGNLILIIIYKMLSFDLLFYYAIAYLFLINAKGLTTSQIVFADAFYPLFKLMFQVPCTVLIQKIGKKKSLILSNLSCAIFGFLMLIVTSPITIIIGNAFLAFSFVIKGMAEPTFLYDLITNKKNINNTFSKYESISTSGYYFLDSITSVLAGILYVYNPYFPIIFSFAISIIATLLTCCLKESKSSNKPTVSSSKQQYSTYFKDLSHAFKYIIKSSRLHSLILFNGLLVSTFNLMVTLQRSLLNDVNIPSEKFGLIFAIMGLIGCFSTGRSNYIHNKLHNKTLSVLGIVFLLSIVFSALVVISDLPLFLVYFILLIMTAVQYFIKGPYYTLIKRYLNSFCNSDMRLKIYSANALLECSMATLLSTLVSMVLNHFSNSITTFYLGVIYLILMLILVKYMSKKVGLKPEEYSEKDVFN